MGVMATYCQLCALPVNWDHYVPDSGMYRIFRGDEGDDPRPLVELGPDQAWLRRAAGLRLSPDQEPVVLLGAVHDGSFEDVDADDALVLDGLEERAALHEACYALAGEPDLWSPQGLLPEPPEVLPHCEQLFDFAGFVAEGHGWMLADPAGDSADSRRSRARIEEAVACYHGQRRLPGLVELLRHLVEQGCTSLELHPGQAPEFRRGEERLPSLCGPLSDRRCRDFLFACLTIEQIHAYWDTGAAETVVRIKDLGALRLTLSERQGAAVGRFSPAGDE